MREVVRSPRVREDGGRNSVINQGSSSVPWGVLCVCVCVCVCFGFLFFPFQPGV